MLVRDEPSAASTRLAEEVGVPQRGLADAWTAGRSPQGYAARDASALPMEEAAKHPNGACCRSRGCEESMERVEDEVVGPLTAGERARSGTCSAAPSKPTIDSREVHLNDPCEPDRG